MTHVSVHGGGLAGHALDHHGDGHARGEPVRVEEHVGHQPRLGEGQVLGGPALRADALLPRAGRELVAHRRVALRHTFALFLFYFIKHSLSPVSVITIVYDVV
jgi:hypothetical protein